MLIVSLSQTAARVAAASKRSTALYSHRCSENGGKVRTRPTTSRPRVDTSLTTFDPTNPLASVTRTRTR